MTVVNLDLVQVYTEGIKAWFADEELGWVSASVTSKEQDTKTVKILFQDDDNAERVGLHRSITKLETLLISF